jgi:hypothetical protein
MATTSTDELPLGTSPAFARMHTYIRRVCYVLLFALVIEGALTFPLLAIWYGFPELSPTELCSELEKVMYSDGTRECAPAPFPGPPFAGPAAAEGQTTSRDVWGVQPKPLYPAVGYRALVKNKKEREARQRTPDSNPDGAAPTTSLDERSRGT